MQSKTESIADAFLRHHPLEGIDRGVLSTAVQAMHDEGERAWPRFRVTPNAFAEHLGRLWQGTGDPLDWLANRQSAGLYFAHACLAGDATALASLAQTLRNNLPKYIANLGLAQAEREDVLQGLWLQLLGSPEKCGWLVDYAGRGSLESFLRVVAVRSAVDHLRQQLRRREDPDDGGSLLPAPDTELEYVKIKYRQPVRDSLTATLKALETDDRLLLKLYFVQRLSIDRLAKVFGIHRSTAARRVEHLSKRVQKEFSDRLGAELGVAEPEAQELLALVSSRLDISLPSLLDQLE